MGKTLAERIALGCGYRWKRESNRVYLSIARPEDYEDVSDDLTFDDFIVNGGTDFDPQLEPDYAALREEVEASQENADYNQLVAENEHLKIEIAEIHKWIDREDTDLKTSGDL